MDGGYQTHEINSFIEVVLQQCEDSKILCVPIMQHYGQVAKQYLYVYSNQTDCSTYQNDRGDQYSPRPTKYRLKMEIWYWNTICVCKFCSGELSLIYD